MKMTNLTELEQRIAIMAAESFSNNEIAMKLNLNEEIVKNELKTIYKKLNICNRVQLAILCL